MIGTEKWNIPEYVVYVRSTFIISAIHISFFISESNMLLQLFWTSFRVQMPSYRVFSCDVTVAMLVFRINPSGTEPYSYANVFFCFDTEYILPNAENKSTLYTRWKSNEV